MRVNEVDESFLRQLQFVYMVVSRFPSANMKGRIQKNIVIMRNMDSACTKTDRMARPQD